MLDLEFEWQLRRLFGTCYRWCCRGWGAFTLVLLASFWFVWLADTVRTRLADTTQPKVAVTVRFETGDTVQSGPAGAAQPGNAETVQPGTADTEQPDVGVTLQPKPGHHAAQAGRCCAAREGWHHAAREGRCHAFEATKITQSKPANDGQTGSDRYDWRFLVKVVCSAAAYYLLYGLARARTRVCIGKFESHGVTISTTGPVASLASPGAQKNTPGTEPAGTTELDASGIGPLLLSHLSRLRDLYCTVGDRRVTPATPAAVSPIDPTLSVDQVQDSIQQAVSSTNKVTVLGLQIPVGLILGALGQFTRGPRVTGSLFSEGDVLFLTAEWSERGKVSSWRVDRSLKEDTSDEQRYDGLDKMVEELATRIFAEMALKELRRWKAVRAFTDGLRSYRDCLRTPLVRAARLQEAEYAFGRALDEDGGFKFAHYNLGLVLREREAYLSRRAAPGQPCGMPLREHAACEDAFRKAISTDPENWHAYYALALARWEFAEKREDGYLGWGSAITWEELDDPEQRQRCVDAYQEVVDLSLRVVDLEPGFAPAYDLLAFALRRLHPLRPAWLFDVLKVREQALRAAWKHLGRTERRKDADTPTGKQLLQDAYQQVADCQHNLAQVLVYLSMFCDRAGRHARETAARLMRGSIRQVKSDASLYVGLGRVYLAGADFERARREFEHATRIAPDNGSAWAMLAVALDGIGDKGRARANDAWHRALDVMDHDSEGAVQLYHRGLRLWQEASPSSTALKGLTARTDRLDQMLRFLASAELNSRLPAIAAAKPGTPALVFPAERIVRASDESAQNADTNRWALGRLHARCAHCLMQKGDFKDIQLARDWLWCALCVLENSSPGFPGQVRRLGLHPLLIRMDRLLTRRNPKSEEPGRKPIKLLLDMLAWQAENPLSDLELKELGVLYFELDDFENAKRRFDQALQRQPADPETVVYRGRCEWAQALDTTDRKYWASRMEKAEEFLKLACGLYGPGELELSSCTNYWLGRLNYDRAKYEEAIHFLQMAQALNPSCRLPSLHLGFAFLKNYEYDKCQSVLTQLIEELVDDPEADKPRLKKGPSPTLGREINDPHSLAEKEDPSPTLGWELNDPHPLAETVSLAYSTRALCKLERGGNSDTPNDYPASANTDLEHANHFLAQIGFPVPQASTDSPLLGKSEYEEAKFTCVAACYHVKGLGSLDRNDIVEAIAAFKTSVGLRARRTVYLRLAQAHLRLVSRTSQEAERYWLRLKVEEWCDRLSKRDLAGEFDKDVEKIRSDLEKFSKTAG